MKNLNQINVLSIVILCAIFYSCKSSNSNEPKTIVSNSDIAKIETTVPPDCNSIQQSFTSYDQAIRIIKETKFAFTDHLNTTSSSWIRSASYFSCDNVSGYFILYTENSDYLYRDIPKTLWENFKHASSFGTFYHQNIKNNYQYFLTLNK
jgi:hypothetical protein